MSAPRRRNNPGRGAPAPANRHNIAGFWGPDSPPPVDEVPATVRIRPTNDPAAVPRSLGDAPLGASPAVVAHHLAVVYEEAVKAATALAAANGLLDDEPWLGDGEDEDD